MVQKFGRGITVYSTHIFGFVVDDLKFQSTFFLKSSSSVYAQNLGLEERCGWGWSGSAGVCAEWHPSVWVFCRIRLAEHVFVHKVSSHSAET